jgi:hypothetical protein
MSPSSPIVAKATFFLTTGATGVRAPFEEPPFPDETGLVGFTAGFNPYNAIKKNAVRKMVTAPTITGFAAILRVLCAFVRHAKEATPSADYSKTKSHKALLEISATSLPSSAASSSFFMDCS